MAAKDVNCFDLFVNGAKICCKAAEQLQNIIKEENDILGEIKAINEIEREGDRFYNSVYEYLNRTFITPIEIEDVLQIARYIEEIINTIGEAAMVFNMFSISKARPKAKELILLIVRSCNVLLEAMIEFKNFKRSNKVSFILTQIKHLEENGNRLYQNAVKNLFNTETNVVSIIKWKNVFDALQDVLNTLKKAADLMKGAIVKNS